MMYDIPADWNTLNCVRDALKRNPKGLTISDLRQEMIVDGVTTDRRYLSGWLNALTLVGIFKLRKVGVAVVVEWTEQAEEVWRNVGSMRGAK